MTGRTGVLYVGGGSDAERRGRRVEEYLDAAVVVVESPAAAVRFLQEATVDCVVSEQAFPDADGSGLELLEVVRDRWSELPFVLVPADGSESLASDAVSAGVTEYVPRGGDTEDDAGTIAGVIRDVTDEAGPGSIRTREQYEQLFEHAPVMFVVTRQADGEPVVEDCNARFLDRLGYPREQVVGRSLASLYTEESTERLLSGGGYNRALSGAFDTETRRLRAADGEIVETELHAAPRYDADGEVVGTLAMYFDVTERQQRERQLELFRALLDQSTDEVYVVDPRTGSLVDVNRTACDRLGYERSELLDLSVSEVVAPLSDRGDWSDHLDDVEDGPTIVEADHRRADGDRYPVEVTLASVDLGGEFVVAIARDVSDRQRRQRRFRALIENATDLITVLRPDGRIRYQSPSIERVLGYDGEEVVGESVFDLVHPEDRAAVREAVTESEDSPSRVVFRARHVDGSWRVLEGVATDQLADDAVNGYVLNSRDVTERIDRERQLAVVDRVLRHNVRNDMDVVMGYAEAVANNADGAVAEAAETIRQRGRTLLETVEKEREIVDVLMAGSDGGTADPTAVVAGAAEAIRSRYPGATVRTDLPEEAPPVISSGRLERAFVELLENAVVHADRPDPTVEVDLSVQHDRVCIDVVDDGPGIPAEEVEVLTREREIDPLSHGSGMGLWLVNWIVRRSDGTLSFEERDDGGSVVTVDLRRAESDDVAGDLPGEATPGQISGASDTWL